VDEGNGAFADQWLRGRSDVKVWKCQLCDEPASSNLFRCDKHYYRCDECGSKEDLIYGVRKVECSVCEKRRVDREISEFNGDTDYQDLAVCPWCGNRNSESWELDDDSSHTCCNCERDYELSIYVEISYSTTKVREGRQ